MYDRDIGSWCMRHCRTSQLAVDINHGLWTTCIQCESIKDLQAVRTACLSFFFHSAFTVGRKSLDTWSDLSSDMRPSVKALVDALKTQDDATQTNQLSSTAPRCAQIDLNLCRPLPLSSRHFYFVAQTSHRCVKNLLNHRFDWRNGHSWAHFVLSVVLRDVICRFLQFC